ncbi:MAG: acyl-CoA dehydrogenase [Actinomycetota bacterium]|jgi:alkylation response protein AidB-like acyl-CoA dehydrogenase|nr:acyl-CoA dehydrogenase [Actinomycetota bacterium]
MGHRDFPVHLSAEQRELLVNAQRIAQEELAPIARKGAPGRVNRDLVRALGDHGVLPQIFPVGFGGSSHENPSASQLCLLREGLAGGSTEAETAFALQGLGAYPILQSGSDALRDRWIPKVASGECVAAFALTEERGGSDAGNLEMRAEKVEGGYLLTGEKKWISNAPEADMYTVFARTTPDAGPNGITAFVVPANSEGLGGEPLELLSPHAIGTLVLKGTFVPNDHVLGEVDKGFGVAMGTLDLFRSSVGAFAVGMAQAALDAAVAFAEEREAFKRPIREFQAVSHKLAEMAARTKAARLLVYDAAATYDSGERVTKASAIAKLYATETAQFVIDAALQIHGAKGLEKGHLLEHLYRDVRSTRIYEGTSEIQREVIARELYR